MHYRSIARLSFQKPKKYADRDQIMMTIMLAIWRPKKLKRKFAFVKSN